MDRPMEGERMKVGVMIVGARGATASTLIATAKRPRAEDLEKFLVSEQVDLPLVALDEIAWGGWDVIDESWAQTFARHRVLEADADLLARMEQVSMYPPVLCEIDHA